MKTTLTALIAALFLFSTPLLAAAHDGGQRNARVERHDRGERDRHQDRHDYRDHRDHHRRDYRSEKRFRKHQQRHHAHYQQQRYPVYAPAVIFGVPRIVFRIDW